MGVYSRYPLIDEDFWAYQEQSSRLRFAVEVAGKRVTIYDVHLANPFGEATGYNPDQRPAGITDLLTMLAGETDPLIVAGDFNMPDATVDYSRMTAHLTDSFRESGYGLGLTFPTWSPAPLIRLDYVFHSADLRSLGAQVGTARGSSDHYPLSVELALTD